MLIDVHLDPDGERYVTRKQAADMMGVKPSTISTWEARGRLKRLSGLPPRRPLYRLVDVVEAEFQTRDAAIRTSGSETRVIRHFGTA